ncbi:hypothetical protein BS47DRAFT_1406808 [Hydnum rufescens UP504]|uniref:Major facilitator superfamily (MFS) profile domain-containing protein n=1 Tax=Hydnum rufescens UP504 TaxID=1448309 RepID=A0A9P6ARU6_9AGAM|nr:hypothetical protein BS47DRAFT_1406808 [Hydnum rufescens UP504]
MWPMSLGDTSACNQVGLVFFFIGSTMSTGSLNMATMLAGRGVAGVGAAALLTVTRVIMADSRTLDSNVWQTVVMSLLFSIGFSIAYLSTVSYRWIFAINLPISLVSGALAFLLIRKELLGPQADRRDELPDRVPSNGIPIIQRLLKVDWLGAFIFVSAFILVLLGMSWGSTQQWNQGKVIVTIVLGCILLVVFIGWEYYLGQFEIILNVDGSARPSIPPKKAPRLISRTNRMIPLYIFTNFDMVVTSFACVTGGMVMFGCLYFLSIYWNVAAAFRATQSGTQLLYLSPGLGGGLYWSLLLIKHTRQSKWPIILGQVIQPVAVGLLGMAVDKNAHGQINGFLGMTGAGIGLTIASLEIQSRFALPNEHTAVSVTMNLFFRTAGGTIGLAQMAAVLESKIRSYINKLITSGAVSPSDGLAIISSLASLGRGADGQGIETLPPKLQDIVRAAYGYGTKWAFFSLLPWCVLATFPCFFLHDIPDVAVDHQMMAGNAVVAQDAERPGDENTADDKSHNGVPRGPRIPLWVPFSFLLYGIELLLGTRRRRSTP